MEALGRLRKSCYSTRLSPAVSEHSNALGTIADLRCNLWEASVEGVLCIYDTKIVRHYHGLNQTLGSGYQKTKRQAVSTYKPPITDSIQHMQGKSRQEKGNFSSSRVAARAGWFWMMAIISDVRKYTISHVPQVNQFGVNYTSPGVVLQGRFESPVSVGLAKE